MFAAALLALEVTATPLGSLYPPPPAESPGFNEPASIAWTGEVFVLLWQQTLGAYWPGVQLTRMTPAGEVLDVPVRQYDAYTFTAPQLACGTDGCLAIWSNVDPKRQVTRRFGSATTVFRSATRIS